MPSNNDLESRIDEVQQQLFELIAKHEELAMLFGRVVTVVQEMKGSGHQHVTAGTGAGAGDRVVPVGEKSSDDSLGESSE